MRPCRDWLAATLVVASLSAVNAQQVYDATHNVTSLLGTWSSGSGAVRTGVVSLVSL